MMKPDYIFISGVSRTGTTLLLRILNKSTEISITNRENWFLGHQLPWEGIRYAIRRNVGELSDDDSVRRMVDFLYDGKYKRNDLSYWYWLRHHIDREEFLQKMLASPDRSERGIFAVMMDIQGRWLLPRHNKPVPEKLILGEKTPSHLYYIPTLLEWFPNSKTIHTFRDPRGIFASELRRRKQYATTFPYKQLFQTGPLFDLYILSQVTYAWLRAVRLHFKYQKLYPDQYCLVRFEDLVTDSEGTIKQLCAFLEVDFQEGMLEQKVVSYGFQKGQTGFDQQAADRWKETNPSWVNSWFLFQGKEYLKALGYIC